MDRTRSVDDDILTQIISAREAAEMLGLSQAQVTYLLRHGTMNGKKIGREWITTTNAVQLYRSSNPRPGPKPRGI